ncbi:uncharacterized protein F5891DRAFT_703429 [Suillus fuscotomentosus]|uniref:Secreted protein n=1 Tax=Suillus fuscotomentosus TaxID=1912939 RepID=A0AAD4DY92_9AGAM|nr:uncharacterized protein F5891DRAFT_703429 [Suillus fuscotomentosus]KAG1894843.1 hypothetical protein F5891DRAFT_703429 [Suillus fuscotomentosus]
MTLPSVPLPGNVPFSVLHIALLLQLVLLHLPNSPSLPSAIKPESTIPLSTLLSARSDSHRHTSHPLFLSGPITHDIPRICLACRHSPVGVDKHSGSSSVG